MVSCFRRELNSFLDQLFMLTFDIHERFITPSRIYIDKIAFVIMEGNVCISLPSSNLNFSQVRVFLKW